MADLTVAQIAAINTQLSVNLSTVTDDRLIELCLLYRSAPSVRPAFVAALNAEITRSFTPDYIAANDVMFSVIQNFANQFNPELQYKEKMYELVNALDREVWIAENVSFFEATLTVPSRVEWLLNDSVVFNAVFESSLASNKLFNSSVAISAVIASSTAMTAVVASSVAMSAVAASSVAMTAVVASSVAMNKIAVSSIALSAIVKSTAARNALMGSNTILQNNRVAIYNTVIASWTKNAGVSQNGTAGNGLGTINNAVANPAGFVFASLGWGSNSGTGISAITHPDDTLAAAKGTSGYPNNLNNLDAVSFNGATFKATISGCQAYAELWKPPT